MSTLNTSSTYYPLPITARYATLKDESAVISIEGALSFSLIDESAFRQFNYWDEVPASFVGGPADVAGSSATTLQVFDDVAHASSHDEVINTSVAVQLSTNAAIIQQSDSFTHVAPHPEVFKRTMMVFWSGATGAGNVVAYLDFSKFDQFSSAIPVRY